MNVNRLSSIEKQALFRQKFIQEGKPAEKANEEIERDISFEENLAWNLKENKKLKNKMQRLENSLEIWKRKYMNLELSRQKESREIKSEVKLHQIKNGNASVQHCNRVINFLRLTDWAGKDDIKKSCSLCYNIDIILNFLMQNRIIVKQEDKSRNGRFYFIYSLKDKMKGGEDERNTNSN